MIKMLINDSNNDWLESIKINSANHMQTNAEKLLNPYNYHLSPEAKKRLRWLYILYYEQNGNVSKSAKKIGITRQWLSFLKSVFENSHRDPRSLEPMSKAPHDTSNRKRISRDVETAIIEVRDEYGWGKIKISAYLKNEKGMNVSHNTANKYLHIHKRICPKISLKNIKAWEAKKQRDQNVVFKVKFRPPRIAKDYAPGALIEKDMKYVPKLGRKSRFKTKDDFWYQHTSIDSFTRIRVMELTRDFESKTAALAHREAVGRLPFSVACANTDNGSENNGDFSDTLQKEGVFHFYSNTATPTDNPRVERSHLTDELEFYGRQNLYRDFEKQKEVLRKWEHTYNFLRPHQALGYLPPMKFYELWEKNPKKAFEIVEKWQAYLKKQSKRLAQARRIKKREQIEALMRFIDAKLNKGKGLKEIKLQLIDCQLCSVA